MKKLLISSTLLLLVCTSLPLAKISAASQVNKNQQSPPHAIIHQKQASHTRSVTQFKSTRQPSQLDWFNKLKQAIADSNIAATTSNTSTFNMNIKYSGFNSFGIKVKHVVKSVGGNLKQPNLNIGLSLLSQVQVQVPGHSSTWDKYIEDSDDTLNYSKVRESSVTYKIVATGSKNDEAVAFVMSYAPRNAKVTDKKVDLQLGHFDVYNENTNDKKYWESTGGGIAAGVLLVVLLAVIGTVFAWNRASIRRYFTAQWVSDPIPVIPNISTGESVLGKMGTTADDTLNGELSETVLRTPAEQERQEAYQRLTATKEDLVEEYSKREQDLDHKQQIDRFESTENHLENRDVNMKRLRADNASELAIELSLKQSDSDYNESLLASVDKQNEDKRALTEVKTKSLSSMDSRIEVFTTQSNPADSPLVEGTSPPHIPNSATLPTDSSPILTARDDQSVFSTEFPPGTPLETSTPLETNTVFSNDSVEDTLTNTEHRGNELQEQRVKDIYRELDEEALGYYFDDDAIFNDEGPDEESDLHASKSLLPQNKDSMIPSTASVSYVADAHLGIDSDQGMLDSAATKKTNTVYADDSTERAAKLRKKRLNEIEVYHQKFLLNFENGDQLTPPLKERINNVTSIYANPELSDSDIQDVKEGLYTTRYNMFLCSTVTAEKWFYRFGIFYS